MVSWHSAIPVWYPSNPSLSPSHDTAILLERSKCKASAENFLLRHASMHHPHIRNRQHINIYQQYCAICYLIILKLLESVSATKSQSIPIKQRFRLQTHGDFGPGCRFSSAGYGHQLTTFLRPSEENWGCSPKPQGLEHIPSELQLVSSYKIICLVVLNG
jgi:hypothetical protein